jgi:hypothetical protein
VIILEKPYVSEFLQRTVAALQVPVLATPFSRSLEHAQKMNLVEAESFFARLRSSENALLYSNSENATVLLNQHCPELNITRDVNYFKNKSTLRKLFSPLNPDMWHHLFTLTALDRFDVSTLKKPFVIKPVRGFASIGIHVVHDEAEWKSALESIKQEVKLMQDVFPDVVVSLDEFLIEKYIEGTEIAIDAYFNKNGEPVILNILTHLFGSQTDTSDRLYMTSDEIVMKYHDPIIGYLKEIARLRDLRNFPFHLEMRQDGDGAFVPIEINPMRFMGFCVADVEYYFYGINPYEYYFHQKRPDWERILSTRGDRLYGMFGIDIPKHLDKKKISFEYDKFIGHFSRVIHYTKMDYRKYPMAIYLFAEVAKSNFREFEEILYSDLSEFIRAG